MLKCPSSGLGVLRTMGDVMVTPVLVEAENTWKMVSLDLLASLQSHHQAMCFLALCGFSPLGSIMVMVTTGECMVEPS